jgi:hypothetical protein
MVPIALVFLTAPAVSLVLQTSSDLTATAIANKFPRFKKCRCARRSAPVVSFLIVQIAHARSFNWQAAVRLILSKLPIVATLSFLLLEDRFSYSSLKTTRQVTACLLTTQRIMVSSPTSQNSLVTEVLVALVKGTTNLLLLRKGMACLGWFTLNHSMEISAA